MTQTPTAFIGHGSPMNAIEHNQYTSAWRQLGSSVGRPKAILVISAHWFINATAVTAMRCPRTIHDFYGFPPELFEIDYPAPGSPDLADEISEIVKPTWVGADVDSWGFDHGTWSVLRHAFPNADIPVIQLSINAEKPLSYHFDLGTRLAALRARGVLVLGSGNIVHNLRAMRPIESDAAFDWAVRFDSAAQEAMQTDPASILRLREHRDFTAAVPTPDHFIPSVYIAGILAASATTANLCTTGYVHGSLSMSSYVG